MAKRHALESLEMVSGTASPATKRSRRESNYTDHTSNGFDLAIPARPSRPRQSEDHHGISNAEEQTAPVASEADDEEDEEIYMILKARRQDAPSDGFDDLYLDTIQRRILDFDFEKLCSISLSNINVYACLVCGKYFQGRGPKSHAYFHALELKHHVYINMQTQKIYVLPEGYEVKHKSLDDIKFVSNPTYSKEEIKVMDKLAQTAWTLDGKEYTAGFVGINNIKENDYFNVIMQALAHVTPIRNYCMLESFANAPELSKRFSILIRKIWNPRAFKSHVSPHELLQAISQHSNKKFNLTTQSDPVDFLAWFLNNLHLAFGGSRTKPGSSIIHRVFQGKFKVESQAITTKADAGDRLRFEEAAEVKTDISRFLMLTLDLPAAPLFQDELERNIIPQIPLTSILNKYDGLQAQEHLVHRRRYRLLHPLPPYLLFHIKRFSANKFLAERNPTIVTFDARNLDMAPYVEPNPALAKPGEPIWYDLVANVVHEAIHGRDDAVEGDNGRNAWKCQVLNRATGEWLECQDLWVRNVQRELLYLGESYLQIWERRRER